MVDKSTLDVCLRGIGFPADGEAIAACAGYNECPSDILSQVRADPARVYRSEEELLCNLGSSVYC